MEWYEIAIVGTAIALFCVSMYQAQLVRSEIKLSHKPVLAFHLDFGRNRINLRCENIGSGLAKDIKLVIKTSGAESLKPEYKFSTNGLAKNDRIIINDWQKLNWSGVGAYTFDCVISGSCKDIFNIHTMSMKNLILI